jgi:hypothetical protein
LPNNRLTDYLKGELIDYNRLIDGITIILQDFMIIKNSTNFISFSNFMNFYDNFFNILWQKFCYLFIDLLHIQNLFLLWNIWIMIGFFKQIKHVSINFQKRPHHLSQFHLNVSISHLISHKLYTFSYKIYINKKKRV